MKKIKLLIAALVFASASDPLFEANLAFLVLGLVLPVLCPAILRVMLVVV